MPSQGIYRGRPARLRWGTSFASALDVLVDAPISYAEPNEASEFALSPSGEEDAWISRVEQFLEFDARWIPNSESLSPRRASGWDGTTGWNAALSWLRQKNTAKFHPDARNLVVSPKMNADANADGVVDDFTFTATAAVTAAKSVDATDGAQKLQVTASTGNGWCETTQTVVGVMPGEVLTLSAECRFANIVGNAGGYIAVKYRDAAGGALTEHGAPLLTQAAYTRAAVTTPAAPALTAKAIVVLRMVANVAGATGDAWYRNALLERASAASAAFIDNPSLDVKLQEPMKGAPDFESNFLRKLHVKLRAVSGSFDGY